MLQEAMDGWGVPLGADRFLRPEGKHFIFLTTGVQTVSPILALKKKKIYYNLVMNPIYHVDLNSTDWI